ncbi:MAG: hypothetical protein ACLPYZ_14460, partial [Limisphaerales bacterium]
SGSLIFGTHNCGAARVILRNGIMFGGTPCEKALRQGRKIGLMQVNRMSWFGTINEIRALTKQTLEGIASSMPRYN